jgi:phosphoribosylanthranilate isomerase
MRCRIKICGVTSVADALAAVDCGADALGLNFYAPSPRCISEETAIEILRALPPFVEPVQLAVDEPWDVTLSRRLRLPGIRTVQRHDECPECCPGADVRWVPAFPLRDDRTLRQIERLLERCRAYHDPLPAAVLIDAHVPGQRGGTGQVAPWEVLEGFAPGIPIVLAGGLNPDNVAEAVRRVRPYAVDVASGVEYRPGVKDPDKMRRFVQAVRQAEQLAT